MDVSIVVPLFNEEESLPELFDWIKRVCTEHKYAFEVIFVNDGSTDNSWEVIRKLGENNPEAKGISFRKNQGKSAALNRGFRVTSGKVVITMDADLQDSPEEIPALVKGIQEDGYHLISGWKKKRYDPLSKTLPTKLFNWATRKMSKIELHDFNCGLKAYRGDVVKSIEVTGEMHRYIPFLAKNKGFDKIGEQVVAHQARKYGNTKFGWDRFINGFLDLITLATISKFGRRPMHFFGLLGTFMFLISTFSLIYIGAVKLYRLNAHLNAGLITDNPWFYISLTSLVIGIQLFVAGFLAEIILRSAPRKTDYTITATTNLPEKE